MTLTCPFRCWDDCGPENALNSFHTTLENHSEIMRPISVIFATTGQSKMYWYWCKFALIQCYNIIAEIVHICFVLCMIFYYLISVWALAQKNMYLPCSYFHYCTVLYRQLWWCLCCTKQQCWHTFHLMDNCFVIGILLRQIHNSSELPQLQPPASYAVIRCNSPNL